MHREINEHRLQQDVLDLKPGWLSIMIGINDVWHHYDSPLMGAQVGIDLFRTVYEELIEKVRRLMRRPGSPES